MSEGLYANPGSIKDFPSGKKKESIVDIYVSAESLRVYDNPWVENTSPNTPGPTGAQQTVTDKTRKRNHVRSCSMFLGLLCLLLLVGIICIGVKMNNNKNNCDSQRTKLLEDESNLIKRNHELAANNTKLGKEIDRLRKSYCVEPRKKQECNDVPQKKSL